MNPFARESCNHGFDFVGHRWIISLPGEYERGCVYGMVHRFPIPEAITTMNPHTHRSDRCFVPGSGITRVSSAAVKFLSQRSPCQYLALDDEIVRRNL